MAIRDYLRRSKVDTISKETKWLTAEGTPKTVAYAGGGSKLGGGGGAARSEKTLKEYWNYYKGDGTVFSSINTIAWNTVMVGYKLSSDDEKSKELIQAKFDIMDLDGILLDNVIYALVYGDAFIEKVKSSKNPESGKEMQGGKPKKPKGYVSYLKTVDPTTMVINTDKYGNEESYQQKLQGQLQKTKLTNENIIHLRLFPQSSSPYGISLIEPSKNTINRMMGVDTALYSATIRHGCYDDSTEILTEDGWKLFKDLTRKEKVATFNPDNKSLEYKLPTEYVEYEWDGELDYYTGRFIDLATTPDHDHYLKFQHGRDRYWTGYKKTNKIESNCFKFKAFTDDFKGDECKVPDEFEGWTLSQFVRYLGWYISEGYTHSERQRESIIYQSENSDKLNTIRELFEELPIKYVEKVRDRYDNYSPCHSFFIRSSKIGRYLSTLGKHDTKYIPKKFKNLPKEYLSQLFESLMDGDGHKYGDGLFHYYTTSKQLADDVQEIALKLGYSTRVISGDRDNENWSTSYTVRCRKTRGMEPYFTKDRIKKVNYKGKVYCVRVQNHLFIVRRNGMAVISGNTPKYVVTVGTEDEIPPKAVLDKISSDLENITYNNEFTVPGPVKITTIDEKGVRGVEDYSTIFQKKTIVGLMCPEESLGMSIRGSSEATAKVREVMFERFIQALQHKLANKLRVELINPMLLENGKEENTVAIKFRSVTTADEEGYAKWFGNLLRGFQFANQKPVTVNEIRDAFRMEPIEGGDDITWGGQISNVNGEGGGGIGVREDEEETEEKKPKTGPSPQATSD